MTRKATKKKPIKKVAKKSTPVVQEIPDTRDSVEKKLNLNQDLFCRFYTENFVLRGNATRCYAEAYGYDLDSYSKDDAVYSGKGRNRKVLIESSFTRAEHICAVNGNKLLRNAEIQKRILKLYNDMLKDEVVDGELTRLIMQNDEYSAKASAIREYNKLKGRIIDKKLLTDAEGKALPVIGLTIHVPDSQKA